MKPEWRQHLEMAERSVEAARELLDAGHSDFALSRAYYDMFYAAEALLSAKRLQFKKHSGVHGAYGREFAKTGILDPKYHRWMLEAFSRRLEADYDVGARISEEEAQENIRRAGEFLVAAGDYLAAEE